MNPGAVGSLETISESLVLRAANFSTAASSRPRWTQRRDGARTSANRLRDRRGLSANGDRLPPAGPSVAAGRTTCCTAPAVGPRGPHTLPGLAADTEIFSVHRASMNTMSSDISVPTIMAMGRAHPISGFAGGRPFASATTSRTTFTMKNAADPIAHTISAAEIPPPLSGPPGPLASSTIPKGTRSTTKAT